MREFSGFSVTRYLKMSHIGKFWLPSKPATYRISICVHAWGGGGGRMRGFLEVIVEQTDSGGAFLFVKDGIKFPKCILKVQLCSLWV